MASVFATDYSLAQCPNNNSIWVDLTPTGAGNTQSTSCIWGGEYVTVSVCSGASYTFETCASTWDTQITLYNAGTNALVGYNDDFCGLQSTITWTATYTGTLNVLVDQFNCTNNTICGTLTVTQNTACGGGGGGAITTCSDTFYDTGGAGGNYANNQYYTVTYCPANPGECIRVDFSSFNLETNFDFLFVYDGSSIAAPLIQGYTGTQLNGVSLQANNASGCLTFEFDSDFSITSSGWAASISCVECDDLPSSPPEDCNGGITICSDETFNGNSSGPGVQELNSTNSGCLSFENESTWYFFSPQSTGTIAFMLEPNPIVDYDFAVWGPYDVPSCPPSEPPLRCSWSAAYAYTGLQAGAGDNSEGAGGDAVVNPITVGPADVGKVYMVLIDNWTASTTPFTFNWNLGGGLSLDCTVLPVDFLSFEGERKDQENYLSWETASETNSDFFAVERSLDAEIYEEIGLVSAAGHSSTVKQYSFVDDTVSDVVYYRLKQVDFDGAYAYYGPIAISGNTHSNGITIGDPYPNPAVGGDVHFDVQLISPMTVTASVLDITGRSLYQSQHDLKQGSQLMRLDLEQLSSGTYHIQLSDSHGTLLGTFPFVR